MNVGKVLYETLHNYVSQWAAGKYFINRHFQTVKNYKDPLWWSNFEDLAIAIINENAPIPSLYLHYYVSSPIKQLW